MNIEWEGYVLQEELTTLTAPAQCIQILQVIQLNSYSNIFRVLKCMLQ